MSAQRARRRLRVERLEERLVLGGGGENVLLVVNPADENALRIANAYQQLRDVPDSNIVFITPPANNGSYLTNLTQAQLISTFITPLANAIASRGLTNQINYIELVGEPSSYTIDDPHYGADNENSLSYGISLLSEISAGLNPDDATYIQSGLYQGNSVPIGDNPAITHSQTYGIDYGPGGVVNTQYYMVGDLGYTWDGGIDADQVIAGLQRAAVADGTHPTGTVYFEDNGDIRSMTRDGQWAGQLISTAAGGKAGGYNGDNMPATAAALDNPEGVAVDSAGNIYIADTANNRVREVNAATGIITAIAGTGMRGYGGNNGPATAAELKSPLGIAVDAAGDVFISDTGNERIREINHATGVITTVAGTGVIGYVGDGGPATAAQLYNPQGIALDAAGNIYIADTYSSRVREINHATGVISTIAGTGAYGYSGDGAARHRRPARRAGGRGSGFGGGCFHRRHRKRAGPRSQPSYGRDYDRGRHGDSRRQRRWRPGHDRPARSARGTQRGRLREHLHRRFLE